MHTLPLSGEWHHLNEITNKQLWENFSEGTEQESRHLNVDEAGRHEEGWMIVRGCRGAL